ncbi:MAG: ParA family protein [Pyrinomonadaceae bacterium]
MKTIVLANHKGGCAKTTTALNGKFKAEWEVTFSDGRKLTCPNDGHLLILISSDLG